MNPYVTDPDNLSAADKYVDTPLYGRYFLRPDDFRVDLQHVNSQSVDSESEQYWASVLDLCDESIRIYPADEGGRDVFAPGSVILKSTYLHRPRGGQPTEIDYSYADANEVQAVAFARSELKGAVRVPEIYFAGTVLVQERIPGVGLNVAWPYLSQGQKEFFKRQAREILRQLHAVKPPADGRRSRCHVVRDPKILTNGRVGPLEGDIPFSDSNTDPDMAFMHNDVGKSNCIVDNDKIVGLVDWEMAGLFGWNTAGEVHRRIRTPQREHFANASLSEDTLRETMWWNDLYDEGMPEPRG